MKATFIIRYRAEAYPTVTVDGMTYLPLRSEADRKSVAELICETKGIK